MTSPPERIPGGGPIVALVGPTAAGKSDLSLALAEWLGGEVINTDSMQLYRGMDIGTAKLTLGERRGVPHHLLDVLEITDVASVAEFQGWARAAIADCRARGAVPILVGGSALYTRAVIDRFDFPGTDPEVRARLDVEVDKVGAPALHARLASLDPEAAAKILPTNARRVVRALEVIDLTGRPFSASLPRLEYADAATVQIGIDIDRPTLDSRIELRVRRMWEAGLVDEVRDLEKRGLREGLTASRALGYQQVLEYLGGDTDETAAEAATVSGTRRFARRQDSWFRKDPRISWLDFDDPQRLEQAAQLVETAVVR